MKIELRPYQSALVDAVQDDLATTDRLAEVVLAGCPGAGKTRMAVALIDRLVSTGAARRVLVLGHGTTVLRDQFFTEASKLPVSFTIETCFPVSAGGHVDLRDYSAQVLVALPQSLRGREVPEFDLVVVDEAHEFYAADMVQDIVTRTGSQRVLLLTGTPSEFVARGMKLHTISLFDLHDLGHASDVFVKVAASAYPLTRADYNEEGLVTSSYEYTQQDTNTTVNAAVDELIAHLGSSVLAKTMVVCGSIDQAIQVQKSFVSRSTPALLSHSDASKEGYDPGSDNLREFKNEDSAKVLIVVNRGVLGFDYPDLANIVDLSGARNVDNLFQLLCRLVRKPHRSVSKTFIKMVPAEDHLYFVNVVEATVSLSAKSVYESYDGNASKLRVRRRPEHEGGTSPKGTTAVPKMFEAGLALITGYMVRVFGGFDDTGSPVASITLGEARCALLGIEEQNSEKKKTQILAFFEKHGRWPVNRRVALTEEARLGAALASYVGRRTSFSYDPEFEARISALGWMRASDRVRQKKSQIVEGFEKTGRTPTELSKDLYEYTTANATGFDRDFCERLTALGWRRTEQSRKPVQDRVVEFFERHGRWPRQSAEDADERRMAVALCNYARPAARRFDPAFSERVTALGWVQRAARPPRARAA